MAPDGNVFVSDYHNARIQIFSSAGVYLAQWGSFGNAIGQFYGPYGLATTRDGYLYIADSGNYRIMKYGLIVTPTRLSTWGQLKSRYR